MQAQTVCGVSFSQVVTIAGDVDGDGEVGSFNLYVIGRAYQSDPMGPSWNPNCDFDNSNSWTPLICLI